jgi:hypothetical protein
MCQTYIEISSLSLILCGAEVCFLSKACQVYDQQKFLVLEGGLCNNVYIMMEHTLMTRLTTSSALLELWHCHLGHLNINTIICMVDKGLITGMTVSNRQVPSSPCKPCLEGKQTYEVICKIIIMHAEHVLGHVYTDVCGPLPVHSHCSY